MSISGKTDPVVRPIVAADIVEALVQGLRDFQAMPLYGLIFGALYAAGGILIVLSLTAFGMIYLAYPLAAGFALVGPFVAIGLYEMSRRREHGLDTSWQHIFDIRFSPSFGAIVVLGLLLMVTFLIWLAVENVTISKRP